MKEHIMALPDNKHKHHYMIKGGAMFIDRRKIGTTNTTDIKIEIEDGDNAGVYSLEEYKEMQDEKRN